MIMLNLIHSHLASTRIVAGGGPAMTPKSITGTHVYRSRQIPNCGIFLDPLFYPRKNLADLLAAMQAVDHVTFSRVFMGGDKLK
jgi:hypothetical protein